MASKTSKKGPRSVSKLKHELDRVFSLYIRAKYPKWCYTCGKRDTQLQCGHFVSRQYLSTRWEEDNCRPQCAGCNLFGNGRPLDFEERLKAELGEARVEELKRSRHTIVKMDRITYERLIHTYTDILNRM